MVKGTFVMYYIEKYYKTSTNKNWLRPNHALKYSSVFTFTTVFVKLAVIPLKLVRLLQLWATILTSTDGQKLFHLSGGARL